MNPLLDAAKQYLAAGLHPFPVAPRDKRPLVAWRQYADTPPTVEQLEAWWRETPDANIGLPMGRGLFVLDVDGPAGVDALEAAGIRLETINEDGRVETGRGLHYYLRGDVPDRIGVLEKVDVRSHGAYVVAPPSVHANGGRYVWTQGAMPRQFPAASGLLLDLLARPTKPTPAAPQDSGWLTAALAGVGEGGRDVTCTRLAGYLLGRGLPADAVEAILIPWGERCSPEFPAEQVTKCVQSIAAKHGDLGVDRPAGVSVVDFVDKILVPGKESDVIPTGLPRLDFAINGGLYPGQVLYAVGMGGVGKSIWAESFAADAADGDAPVLYVPLEMSVAEMSARLLSRYTGINSRRLLRLFYGGVQPEDAEAKMLRAMSKFVAMKPIEFHPGLLSLESLDGYLAERGTTKLVVIDQLHHMDGSQETPGLEANSRGLVRLAKKYDVPVVALCMVNRPESAKRDSDWRPTRWSVRGSERLYHDCDIMLLFHRAGQSSQLEIQVAKGRMGGASDEWMSFPYSPEHCRVG